MKTKFQINEEKRQLANAGKVATHALRRFAVGHWGATPEGRRKASVALRRGASTSERLGAMNEIFTRHTENRTGI